MKFIFIAIAAFCTSVAIAQHNNPYEVFGHTSTVEYRERPVTELLLVNNRDTTSDIRAIAFDMENSIAYLLASNDSVIGSASIKKEEVLRWVSVDPLANKREWVSPYNFVQNNPINRIDPTGAIDDVVITGSESKEAFNQLNSSTNLKLTMDNNGKVTATGKAKTDADKKLLEAITNSNVVVQINATSSNFTDDNKWFIGGAYQGSTVGTDGKTYTKQTVNPIMTKTIDDFYGASKGVSVMHEVLESYIGGVESPGVGGPTFDNTTPEFKAYKNAHDKTELIDPRHKAPNISQDPNTGHLYLNRPHPKFPVLNEEKLINNLSR